MENTPSTPHGLVELAKDTATQYSLYILLAVLLFSCLANRAITGLQSQLQSSTEDELNRIRMLPYWVPGLGHALSFVWGHRDFLLKAEQTMDEPALALKMGFQTQIMIYSPTMAQKLFRYGGTKSDVYSTKIMENFIGDVGPFRRIKPEVLEKINDTLTPIRQGPYLEQISTHIVNFLQRETANLVSFTRSIVDQTLWERNAMVTVEDGSNPPICEANLFTLIRSFTTYSITQTVMGQAFLEFHAGAVEDLWTWEREFVRLTAGAPKWLPAPGISAAYPARERIRKLVSVLQASFLALEDGRDAPMEFRDLDDISELMKTRLRLWKTLGINTALSARLDSWLLWKLTSDTSKLTFWMIFHTYSNPDLLSNILKEIAPFVKTAHLGPKETGLPFMEPPRLSIDFEGLYRSCSLLKATYAETTRLNTNPISYRQLTTDLVLTESDKEATLYGAKKPRSYQFYRGDILGVPCGAHHIDPVYYPNTKTFDPARFISTESGQEAVDWRTVLPFGGDDTFAAFTERQVLAFFVAVISLWDIEPVGPSGWKHPGHRLSANTFNVSRELRVRMKHRI